MKEEALAIAQNVADPAAKLNIIREYVQVRALRSLHESEAFAHLSFVGGTALRLVYGLPRFSEDLDFSLDEKPGYRGEAWMRKLKSDLSVAGFAAAVTWNDRSVVHKAWVRITHLLHEAGLAAIEGQKLSIKLEIDTRPPAGAVRERRLVSRYAALALQHHDLPSLMAGKIHALLTRSYAKGRDWYDLVWYRGRRPPVEPNLRLLQNALDQTRGTDATDATAWQELLLDRFSRLDFGKLAADVAPFLERREEVDLLTGENLRTLLTP